MKTKKGGGGEHNKSINYQESQIFIIAVAIFEINTNNQVLEHTKSTKPKIQNNKYTYPSNKFCVKGIQHTELQILYGVFGEV